MCSNILGEAVLGDPEEWGEPDEDDKDEEDGDEDDMDKPARIKFASIKRQLTEMEAAEEGVWTKEEIKHWKAKMDTIPRKAKANTNAGTKLLGARKSKGEQTNPSDRKPNEESTGRNGNRTDDECKIRTQIIDNTREELLRIHKSRQSRIRKSECKSKNKNARNKHRAPRRRSICEEERHTRKSNS